jgi:hypothetical protein
LTQCCIFWLQALDAEIVVVFEGVSETGALFSGKRSYLPTEIHWGYVFCEITHQSKIAGMRHSVDLSRQVACACCSGNITKMCTADVPA